MTDVRFRLLGHAPAGGWAEALSNETAELITYKTAHLDMYVDLVDYDLGIGMFHGLGHNIPAGTIARCQAAIAGTLHALTGVRPTVVSRIQRRRKRGWQLPAGAACVGRPSRFGNPFAAGTVTASEWPAPFAGVPVRDRRHAVELLRSYLAWRGGQPAGWAGGIGFPSEQQIRDVLRGRVLACWCPAHVQWCHADIHLDIANQETTGGAG